MTKEIKLNTPFGEKTFTEDQLLMTLECCHTHLEERIDMNRDSLNDVFHSAMTHKDPDIMKSMGNICYDLSLSIRTLKMLDEKLGKAFVCDDCKEKEQLEEEDINESKH